MTKSSYEIIDHTADTGLLIVADTLSDIYIQATLGMMDIMFDINTIRPIKMMNQPARLSYNNEENFRAWLETCLHIVFMDEFLFHSITTLRSTTDKIVFSIYGEPFDKNQHALLTEIKAITYHDFFIRRNNGTWEAQVIFDI